MQVIADLHLHSKYSRAVSRDMVLPIMTQFAKKKGLNLLTTGDWTHPIWLREIKSELVELESGVFGLRSPANDQGQKTSDQNEPKFILSVEVSSIYSQGGKVRRIHSLLFAPSIEVAEKMNAELVKRGANLTSDGRPIVGLTPPNLLEILMGIDERSFLIPCHAWTPWFSLYGSMSGFDSIEECFGDFAKYIYGVETGLSSDPAMNWRIKELENRSILSFSDSHSPMKMGRENTVFVVKNEKLKVKNFTYDDIRLAIMQDSKAKLKIGYTIEFYPEEGKYHYTGHRNCKVVYSPKDTKEKGTTCPVCGRGLTIGVMERVEALAASLENIVDKSGKSGIRWITDPFKKHPPYAKLVPLNEIIAESLESTPASVKVKEMFYTLTEKLGSEFEILLKTPIEEIEKVAGEALAQAILQVRQGDIFISPGYDGEYGIVRIKPQEKDSETDKQAEQATLGF
ncbi:MAG: DNA helicase UvrD [Candidatus Levybacteria bacterium]|nr:DNA helicase UvrD [Candidatus Levybacteria bacterium]